MQRIIELNEKRLAATGTFVQPSAVAAQKSSLFKRVRATDTAVAILLIFCGIVSIFTTIGIISILGKETAVFFDAQAYVTVRMPAVDNSITATLTDPINAKDTLITLAFDGDRNPFYNGQYIQIDDEILQVVSRSGSNVDVKRAQNGTTAASHEPSVSVFGMTESQVHAVQPITEDVTTIQLEENYGSQFAVGQELKIGNEEMRVTAVASDAIEVQRGINDSAVHDHPTDQLINVAKETNLLDFLTGTEWRPSIGQFGILPLLVATLEISAIALLIAVPMGLGAAIYLSEYASNRVRNTLKPVLEILAGIPTVVYGFFALTFMSPLLRSIFGETVQFQNMLSAGLVMGILIIPYISSLSEDAISAVPRELREASYGLGATRLETTVKVVLPAAFSGITAAFIIAASRAIGETMIVAMASGSLPNLTFDVLSGAETITGNIARVSGGDLPFESIQYKSIFAIGMALFVMTFFLNMLSTYVIRRFREVY